MVKAYLTHTVGTKVRRRKIRHIDGFNRSLAIAACEMCSQWLHKIKVLRVGGCRGVLFEPIPLVITLIDHIDKLVSPILDASTLGVKRWRGIGDPTSPVSLREMIDMDHVVLSFRLSRASRCFGSMKRTITTLLAAEVLVTGVQADKSRLQ